MKRQALLSMMLVLSCVLAHADGARRVVLVTLDGARWQDVFRGADPKLAADKKWVYQPKEIAQEFVAVPDRARALMPFLQGVMAKQGVLLGNGDAGSCVRVRNPYWFSYPGYNEILTGRVSLEMNTNDKIDNPNVTVLEWLNRQPDYRGSVRAFGSWDVFPFIINRKRSGIPVNAGFEPLEPARSEMEKMLNRMLKDLPHGWYAVRYDAITYGYAMESLRLDKPKVLYIGLGETDEFGHGSAYDQYLRARARSDRWLSELWNYLQSDSFYKGVTTLIVTTDHGRGDGERYDWRAHGSARNAKGELIEPPEEETLGSERSWLGIIGPDVSAVKIRPAAAAECIYADQVAATLLSALGVGWRDFGKQIGQPLFESLLQTKY